MGCRDEIPPVDETADPRKARVRAPGQGDLIDPCADETACRHLTAFPPQEETVFRPAQDG
jgi:hypothetical protein